MRKDGKKINVKKRAAHCSGATGSGSTPGNKIYFPPPPHYNFHHQILWEKFDVDFDVQELDCKLLPIVRGGALQSPPPPPLSEHLRRTSTNLPRSSPQYCQHHFSGHTPTKPHRRHSPLILILLVWDTGEVLLLYFSLWEKLPEPPSRSPTTC